MAVVAVPRVIDSTKAYYQTATESDQLAVGGLRRNTSGAAVLFDDANTTTIAVGGGTANTQVNLGAATTIVRALGHLRVGAATGSAAVGDASFGDGTRSATYSASNNRILFAGGQGQVAAASGNALQVGTLGPQDLVFVTGGIVRWSMTSAGHLTAPDNTLDIGANGATRPRTVYVRTSLVAQGATNSVALADGSLTQTGGTLVVTTTAGAVQVRAGGANPVEFNTNGAVRWLISSAGNIESLSDGSYNIGASGSARPGIGYFATSVFVGTRQLGLMGVSMQLAGAISVATDYGSELIAKAGTLVLFQARRLSAGVSGTTTIELEVNGVATGNTLSWTNADADGALKSATISQAVALGDRVSFRVTSAEVDAFDVIAQVA